LQGLINAITGAGDSLSDRKRLAEAGNN